MSEAATKLQSDCDLWGQHLDETEALQADGDSKALTELVSPETPGQTTLNAPLSVLRQKIAGVIAAVDPGMRSEAFRACGLGHWIMRSKADKTLYKLATDRCHDRLCPTCQRIRSRRIRAALRPKLPGRDVRFVTLTLRADGKSLSERLSRLYADFKVLRKNRLWKSRVTGGVACCETTRNAETGNWNVHLHLMVEGQFLPMADLKEAWLSATGDSDRVDIQRPKGKDAVAQYVTKYCTKAADDLAILPDEALNEYVRDLKHHKTIFTFGSWRRWKLLTDKPESDWTCLCHINEIWTRDDLTPAQRQIIVQAVQLHARVQGEYVFTLDTDSS